MPFLEDLVQLRDEAVATNNKLFQVLRGSFDVIHRLLGRILVIEPRHIAQLGHQTVGAFDRQVDVCRKHAHLVSSALYAGDQWGLLRKKGSGITKRGLDASVDDFVDTPLGARH